MNKVAVIKWAEPGAFACRGKLESFRVWRSIVSAIKPRISPKLTPFVREHGGITVWRASAQQTGDAGAFPQRKPGIFPASIASFRANIIKRFIGNFPKLGDLTARYG